MHCPCPDCASQDVSRVWPSAVRRSGPWPDEPRGTPPASASLTEGLSGAPAGDSGSLGLREAESLVGGVPRAARSAERHPGFGAEPQERPEGAKTRGAFGAPPEEAAGLGSPGPSNTRALTPPGSGKRQGQG